MNTRDLEYLVAVAEELHFHRAAERCNASQPALSGQIRKLEERLGVTLFERTKRQVRITEIGKQVVDQARVILRQVDTLEHMAATMRDPFAGTCKIGMPPTIGPYLTPLLLPAVKHYLPDLQLEPLEDLTEVLEAQLDAGDLDVAILATTPARTNLSEMILYEEPFWVALPNDHPLTEFDAVDIAQIEPSELLLLSDGHCLRDQVYEACNLDARRGPADGGPKTQKTSLTTILSLVGTGTGVTLVPATSLADSWITDAGIAVRPERSGTAGRTVRLTYRKGYHRMVLIERLADIIAGIVPNTVEPVRR